MNEWKPKNLFKDTSNQWSECTICGGAFNEKKMKINVENQEALCMLCVNNMRVISENEDNRYREMLEKKKETTRQGEWIPCGVELPPFDKEVLVKTAYEPPPPIAILKKDKKGHKYWTTSTDAPINYGPIIEWMSPPEE